MNCYNDFAYIYDRLMHSDINYERWADYIENIFALNDISPDLVCDLACGTGNMTVPLARRGYNMTGADISQDMLNIAREKSEGLDILYLCQSITRLDLYGTMGAFICMIDGFNYILSPALLIRALSRIKNCFLDPGGLLIFDISTRYKLQNVIGQNTFIHSDPKVFYAWQNRYLKQKHISDMLLTFFVRQKNGYKRFEERHIQRAYTEEEMRFIVKKAGFSQICTYDELSFSPPRPDSERIVFVCR
ncbi:MAG: methyltransferase domain-containing protein [Clostridiales bacterium]|nr:methyltransferase domain-containing protein [Clostridiales bacterium]